MQGKNHPPESAAHTAAQFATTHWSVVLSAGQKESPEAAQALEKLCRTYWYPLYAYVRRHEHSPEDAQDLTQGFFAHLLAKGFPHGVAPDRGRFRSFLLAALHHYIVDQHRHADAAKRGGGQRTISLDETRAEERFRLEMQDELTPEKHYEREWAMTLLDHAQSRLREEYVAAGKTGLHDRLKGFPLAEAGEFSFRQAATELGMSESALKSAVNRMRTRYRQLVREEVAHTVADPAGVNEEARHLIAVISG